MTVDAVNLDGADDYLPRGDHGVVYDPSGLIMSTWVRQSAASLEDEMIRTMTESRSYFSAWSRSSKVAVLEHHDVGPPLSVPRRVLVL